MNDLANSEKLEFSSNFVIGTTNMGSGHLVPVGVDYLSADGDEDNDIGEADTTEPSGDDIDALAPEEQYLEAKLKDLVREKKLAMKAQYGKGKLIATSKEICLLRNFLKKGSPCVKYGRVPDGFKRVRGWRFEWKKFKQNGGKAQLKQMAKGLVPYVAPTVQQINTTLPIATVPTVIAKPKVPNFNLPKPNLVTAPAKQPIVDTDIETEKAVEEKGQKVLGMSTSIGVPILIAGIVVLSVGAFFAVKYFRKAKA